MLTTYSEELDVNMLESNQPMPIRIPRHPRSCRMWSSSAGRSSSTKRGLFSGISPVFFGVGVETRVCFKLGRGILFGMV